MLVEIMSQPTVKLKLTDWLNSVGLVIGTFEGNSVGLVGALLGSLLGNLLEYIKKYSVS